MFEYGGGVGCVVIHVMTVAHLRRAAMAAPVMGDDAVALAEKIEQLRIPIIAAQRPSVVEDDRLGILRPPVLVVDFSPVFGGDRTHDIGALPGFNFPRIASVRAAFDRRRLLTVKPSRALLSRLLICKTSGSVGKFLAVCAPAELHQ
jgi:hypothetical protein